MNLYDVSVFTHETDEIYHGKAQRGECLSSHKLREFSRSPYRYWNGIQNPVEEYRPEFVFGRAAHTYILEGKLMFDTQFIVSDGPVNPKTGAPYGKAAKAYQEWLAMQERDIVSHDDFEMILRMSENIHAHEFAQTLLNNEDNVYEGVLRAIIDNAMCQIKVDCFNPDIGIVDLKTCREIEFFEKDLRDFGYAYQLAFYRLVYKETTGMEPNCNIIAVDKTDANIAGVWRFPGCELDKYERQVRAQIRAWSQCKSTGVWPTGYENPVIFAGDKS